jgi:hypothetical protein
MTMPMQSDAVTDAETMAGAAKEQLVATLGAAGLSDKLGEQLALVAAGLDTEAATLEDPAAVTARIAVMELSLGLLRDAAALEAHRRALRDAAAILRRDAAAAPPG